MYEMMLAHGNMGEGINSVFILFGMIAIMAFGLARVYETRK